MCMLLNVAAHIVSIRNIKVSKRERHKTYSLTKHTASQNIHTFCNAYVHFTFCNSKRIVTLYVMWRDVYVLKTLRFGTLTLCAATFCNITSLCHVTFTLCCFTLCSNIDQSADPGSTVVHVFWLRLIDHLHAVFRIRINLMRIRIQNFRLNTDPDLWAKGFDDQKLGKNYWWKKLIFFLSNIIYSTIP